MLSFVDLFFAELEVEKIFSLLEKQHIVTILILFELISVFIFRYLPKVFDRYSSADGFLFLHDDTILNYWNLLQADKSKLWITNKVKF